VKAVLLAAGLGTRLAPLTNHIPKCLLPIHGKPLLEIWLDLLGRAGVDEVLVNTHHLAGQVEAFVRQRRKGPRVLLAFEPVLLGSAGTLRANRSVVAGESFFLAANADNLTDFDFSELIREHETGGRLATLALFRAPDPQACGIVELDASGTVTSFVEKPAAPAGDLANAGLYALSPDVIDLIDPQPPKDIGRDLLPRLVGRARGILTTAYLRDIGTLEAYEQAQQDWPASVQA
jgi:mannose-1-phosphate guanylyltransferase